MTRCRRGLSLVVFSLASVLAGSAVHAQIRSGSCNEYRGTLGKNTEIGMTLRAQGDTLEGSYFYRKNLRDIPLTGNAASPRDIVLQEMDPADQPRAEFRLHLAEHSPSFPTAEPLQAEVLQGNWTSAGGKTSYPVSLQLDHACAAGGTNRYAAAGATSEEQVEKNAQAFYDAVVHNKPAIAAQYVAYPATYFDGGERKELGSSAQFLELYPRIFNPAFIAGIARGIPHQMFVSAQGILLADGRVWFDANGKAKHFNNQVP